MGKREKSICEGCDKLRVCNDGYCKACDRALEDLLNAVYLLALGTYIAIPFFVGIAKIKEELKKQEGKTNGETH